MTEAEDVTDPMHGLLDEDEKPRVRAKRGLLENVSKGRVVAGCVALVLVCSIFFLRSFQTSPPELVVQPPCLPTASSTHRYAFATFLSAYNESSDRADQHNYYFHGTRLMNYHLTHAPTTRSNPPLPFIVLVENLVTETKRQQLRQEGAIVLEGEHLTPQWITDVLPEPRWGNVMMKLNLFRQTQYEKICFIDADTLINARIDGIFQDPATAIRPVGTNKTANVKEAGPLPDEYMFAAMIDRGIRAHRIPPKDPDDYYYLNAGFFCFHPSEDLFNYYLSILKLPYSFGPTLPEQNLMNLAHKLDGNMPWTFLNWKWNTNFPSVLDLEAASKTFHGKLWSPDENDTAHGPQLYRMWWNERTEMEAYYNSLRFHGRRSEL